MAQRYNTKFFFLQKHKKVTYKERSGNITYPSLFEWPRFPTLAFKNVPFLSPFTENLSSATEVGCHCGMNRRERSTYKLLLNCKEELIMDKTPH
jgi:hypothetical protein